LVSDRPSGDADTVASGDAGTVASGDAGTVASGDAGTVASVAVAATQVGHMASARARLARGANLGRYVVLEWLGGGGMGVVYLAYDPELDRRVALKLLRAAGGGDPERRTRLLREAQAMARLAHPNVIAVHDVGTVEDEVFVAMEYVDGSTLSAWLREAPQTWKTRLDPFLQAGRGLAAAHAAGIVHRDFKPDNVLVGKDGRVRVVDFGLARGAAVDPSPAEVAETLTRSGGALATPVTRTGALMGTPAYMSPEQFAGGKTDERTDQFSYCVSLYEALYGKRPFTGSTFAELGSAVSEGKIDEVSDRRVSAWLRAAIVRGLSKRPEDRHPSMDKLLAALSHDPARRRRRAIVIAIGLGVVAATGAGVHFASRERSKLCVADDELTGIWDGARHHAAQAAFDAIALPYARDTYRHAEAVLDAYAAAWTAMRVDACEATHRRGEQSAELLDLRMACLDHRRAELRAATDLLVRADAALALKAVKITESLSPLADCTNTDALRSPVRLPADPATRARVAAVETQLASAKANEAAGRYAAGLPIAQAAVVEARRIGYRPLEADALVQLGALQDWMGDAKTSAATFAAAANAALAGRSDTALVHALTDALWVAGYDQRHFDEAERLGQLARGALERLGGDMRAEASLLGYEGAVLAAKGDLDDALSRHRRALELETKLGTDTSATLNNLAITLERKGDTAAALDAYQRALATKEKALGASHPDVAIVLNNIGSVQRRLGHFQEALSTLQRALDIRERALGPEHPQVASTLDNLSTVFVDLNRFDDAIAAGTRALQVAEPSLSATHPQLAAIHYDLGVGLMLAKRYPEAESHIKTAVDIARKAMRDDHPDLPAMLIELGETRVLAQHAAVAIAPLEKAIALLQRPGSDQAVLSNARYILARALWDSGSRERALELADKAKQGFATNGPAEMLAEVDKWLVEHARK